MSSVNYQINGTDDLYASLHDWFKVGLAEVEFHEMIAFVVTMEAIKFSYGHESSLYDKKTETEEEKIRFLAKIQYGDDHTCRTLPTP